MPRRPAPAEVARVGVSETLSKLGASQSSQPGAWAACVRREAGLMGVAEVEVAIACGYSPS